MDFFLTCTKSSIRGAELNPVNLRSTYIFSCQKKFFRECIVKNGCVFHDLSLRKFQLEYQGIEVRDWSHRLISGIIWQLETFLYDRVGDTRINNDWIAQFSSHRVRKIQNQNRESPHFQNRNPNILLRNDLFFFPFLGA